MPAPRSSPHTLGSSVAVALVAVVSVVALGAGAVTTGGPAAAAPSTTVDTAHSGSAAQRLDTRLSAAAPQQADTQGRALVAGRLTAGGVGQGDRPVRLLVKRAGTEGFLRGGVRRTDRQGRVAFKVLPAVTTVFRLAFVGTRDLAPARSTAVTVQARSTRVSIAVSPGTVRQGAPVTVRGVVTDEAVVLPGATVELRARDADGSGAVRTVATTVSGADGTVSFAVTPTRTTSYVLIVRPTESSQLARSRSATVTVQARAAQHHPGDRTSVVGNPLAAGPSSASTPATAGKPPRTSRDSRTVAA